MCFWPLLGIKTTGNHPGPRMPTHSQSITGVSWLQDWPSSYSSRYRLLFTIAVYSFTATQHAAETNKDCAQR